MRWRRSRSAIPVGTSQLITRRCGTAVHDAAAGAGAYNLTVPLILLAIAAALGALAVYERYAGENPIADAIYELRLRRDDLPSLDRAARRNPRRADVVVTMTTLPSRLDRIDLTIKSLLRQTVSPRVIRLNVPHVSRREGAAYRVPDRILALESLHVAACDDFGPGTKLIPALLDARDDDRLLVVDDDRVYHPRFIEQMVEWSERHPDAAGLFARLMTGVPEASLRAEYRKRLWRLLRARPYPMLAMLFVFKCAMHYHQYTMARQMASGRTRVYNSF